jgi:hypothetical protein
MNDQAPMGGIQRELGWLGMGFVLPCASLTFYRQAVRRKLTSAVLFFLVFSLALSCVSALSLARGVASAQAEILRPFELGGIPEIVIQNGVTRVDGPQPLVLFDEERTLLAVDTTGSYRRLDPARYRQGILLTRTELHMMNSDGRYQAIPLGDLQRGLGVDPIVINAETVAQAWQTFSALIVVAGALLMVVWNVLVRFVYVAILALVAWGLVSLADDTVGYGKVLTTGLYACVPALYAGYLLGRLGVSFIFLQTLILLFIWAIALWAIMPEGSKAPPEWPLRGWRALVGVPFLLLLAFDAVFLPSFGAILVWITALATLALLVAAGLWTRRQASPGAAGATGAMP